MLHEYEYDRQTMKKGIIAAVGCSALWGVLPAYWQTLRPISSWVIIIYRIFLVCIMSLLVARKNYSWKRIFEPLKDSSTRRKYFIAGLIITVNWSIFIWAVNANHVIQTSIGYYIEPLMISVLGVILFKEKLTKYKTIALSLASLSVVIILIHFRAVPTIALALAVSFSAYSVIKKTVQQPPLISLFYETLPFAPIALCVIIYLETTGQGAWGVGETYQYFLMLLCGLFTLIPLGLFAYAATRVPLFLLGSSQYISPTLTLLLGVFFMREPFDSIQFIAFLMIWIGLAVFSFGEFRESKKG